ncbi:hypothetical protein TWF102_005459 [Orbilia oligospora]|uniref:Major facilitator superfamily (MFS) profile domain-containing protein n=1 Tax=Orbilia oligospora TaxID=2813651 RepID=A0A7C8NGL3_ORBOL|nr:hypothetical protein TWF103_011275 [Orbilia oligospora]KAF3099483.1 hypothetical protein TWF102_005459 [Orbilia oligospora]
MDPPYLPPPPLQVTSSGSPISRSSNDSEIRLEGPETERLSSFIDRYSPSPKLRKQLGYIFQPYPQLHSPLSTSTTGLEIEGVDSKAPAASTIGVDQGVKSVLYSTTTATTTGVTRTSDLPGVDISPVENYHLGALQHLKKLTPAQNIEMAAPGEINEWAGRLPLAADQHSESLESKGQLVDPADLSFDGPDDKRNARNWSLRERLYGTMVPAFACFVVSFGASVYAPAVFAIQREYGVTLTQALAGITTYVLGMAFGPLIAGPISESVGRRAVYFVALPIAGAFTLGVAYAPNLATILACRFFSAMFGASVLAVGAGTIADIWDLRGTAAALNASCLFLAMAFMGPGFGPLVGFYVIADGRHWRWTMLIMCMLILPVTILVFFARETYSKAILVAEAKKQGKIIKKPPPKEGLKLLFTVTLFRPIKMIFSEPIVCFVSLYNGFCFAVFFAFFESIPYVLLFEYRSSQRGMGNAFISLWIGVLLASIMCALFERYVYQPRRETRIAKGLPPIQPEEKLYAALVGSVLFPVGLFIWAWTARSDINVIIPLIGCVLFGWGAVATFIVTAVYLVHIYNDLLGASALGANSLVRYVMGAAFPLFTVQMYRNLGIPHAGTVLAGISVALMPLPWVIFVYGARLREKSKFINEVSGKEAEDSDSPGV